MTACVFTYLLGGYDRLLEQPAAVDSGIDFICFTDDPTLQSDTWQIELVEPRFPTDLVRSARSLKILGHPRLEAYDVTLCIDASVLLLRSPEELIDAWLTEDVDMALAQHSYREQVLDEFDEVIRLNYDDRARVHEQVLDYSTSDPEALTQRPLWTAIMVRRRTPAVTEAMRLWFDHVLRYSRRDQLSVNVAIGRTSLNVNRVAVDNFESPYHRWPAIDGRRVSLGKANPLGSGPLLSELRRTRRELADIDAQLRDVGVDGTADLHQALGALKAAAAEAESAQARAEDSNQEALVWRARWESVHGVRGASANLLRAVGRVLRRSGS